MIVDFDETDPIARKPLKGEFEKAKPGGPYFHHKKITLKDGEEDVIVIKSITSKWAVTFKIRIDYHIGGEAKHLIVDNNGRPFALTALNCTKPTKLTKEGFINGQVSYQDIWELNSPSLTQAPHPDRHPFGSPYCLPKK